MAHRGPEPRRPPPAGRQLTVAVTGPTGTFGHALLPLLESDERIGRVVGIARRPFDPAEHGWSKMTYRQGDVRDPATLEAGFAGADVVVHLAFLISGTATSATSRAVNVDGTRNALRAAVAAGAARFVYASSVAAYGFHADNPIGLTEDWPTRHAAHLPYAREKAEVEQILAAERAGHPELGVYVLRPSIVLGPHTMGAKTLVPAPLAALAARLGHLVGRLPLGPPVPVARLPMQLVHEDDVARALLACIVGTGPPGTYNIAADGVVDTVDVARAVGLTPIPVPAAPVRLGARMLAASGRLPVVPPLFAWAEAAVHPAIMDTTRARTRLGWRPRYTAAEALRVALAPPDRR